MARIRTIKPEFWTHEALASCSEHARLLAIALLNHADDEGLFLANPALVRASCFPFDEDSTSVRRSLDELSRIGYIEVRELPTKAIGRVVRFKDHQRIDRPQKSKLRDDFEQIPNENTGFDECSTSARRKLVEPSLLEREQGTGNREGEQGTGNREQSLSSASRPARDVPAPEDVVEFWNEHAIEPIKPVRKITPERRAKLRTRLRDPDWPWREAIMALPIPNDEKFTWQPDLDWLVANATNAVKVVEGKYDRRSGAEAKLGASIATLEGWAHGQD